jgi:hypothetical protein
MAETFFYRESREKDYSVISNAFIKNPNLSMKAKGLFCYLLSLPEDWRIYIKELPDHFSDGEDAIRSAVKELKDAGYIKHERLRNAKGAISGNQYTIIENPRPEKPNADNPDAEKPDMEKPDMEKPHLENPALLNTNNTKDLNIQNTENTNSPVENAASVSDGAESENKNDAPESAEKLGNPLVMLYNADELFEKAYGFYPRKEGKADGKQHYLNYLTQGREVKGQGRVRFNHGQLSVAIQVFAEEMQGREPDKIQMFSTFMNSTVIDCVEKTAEQYRAAMQKRYGADWEKLKFNYSYAGQKPKKPDGKGGGKS